MQALPRTANLAAAWQPVGPTQVTSLAYGDVTGRVTAIAIDPADATGNTIYVGTTGGGVWKSVNAAGPASASNFMPLTDTLPAFNPNAGTSAIPSLSIGAIAIANGVLLAGTGDPNDATDSYYGAGVLRSVDSGLTWTLTQGSHDGVAGNHTFFGLGFAGFAFSSATPSLVVAAVAQSAAGVLAGAPDPVNSVMGLYFSADAGITWQMATVLDGSQKVQTPQPAGANLGGNAATAVVWNPVRARFYAAVRYHGFYESPDGQTWTRLAHQPGTGLTTAACPTNPGSLGSANCPIFRGALAVQPATGDTFAIAVDANEKDQGLWQDVCGLAGSSCSTADIAFGTKLPSAAMEVGNGNTAILQGDYNLALAAVPSGSDTLVFTGTVDLYRCSLAAGCVQRNTTNAENGCAASAIVAGAQHAVAAMATSGLPLMYLGNDGGLWRSTDGVNQQAAPCSADDKNHFQNLNAAIGSLAEIVSFAQDPVSATTLQAGMGANGSAGTGVASVTASVAWPQFAAGEGGKVAIDPLTPALWYLSTGAGVSIARCGKGAACTATDFAGPPTIGAAQTASEASIVDAPWMLDPALTANLLVGTCRAWRGPATDSPVWTIANALDVPFGSTAAGVCGANAPVVEALAAGGPASGLSAGVNAGSTVLYAGLAGTQTGGGALGGHLFVTTAGGTATKATAWNDAALSKVTNDAANAGVFNPGGFDISSVAVDAHDATGATVYATVMGFAENGNAVPHLYRSVDFGAHWANLSSNLPAAPANGVLVDPNDADTVYIALDTGVYVTTAVTTCAAANCWSVYGTGLPNAPAISLEAAPLMPTGDGRYGELRVGTYGRGIWQIPLLTAALPAAPAMTLSPLALAFAAQQVGTLSPPQTVMVTNTGNAPLFVSGMVTNGDFNETNGCATVAVGASCTVQVAFLPSATGARTGLLTVYANVAGGQGTVTLTGTALAPAAVVLGPLALTFPSATVGVTSAAQNIAVSNTGGVPVGLTTFTVTGDFSVSASTCGLTLAAATECTVAVTFSPSASGVRSGSFSVVDGVGTQTASLTGTGVAPATDTLSTLSLSFPPQRLNTASPTQQVTVTNSGGVALTLVAAQVASGDFTAVNGCGTSLSPNSSCAISVAYVPKTVGAETGVLAVSDRLRTQQVILNGTGVAPPGISLSPVGGMTFTATAVGSTSTAQTLTLTDNGGLPLLIAGIASTGDFVVSPGANPCGTSLAVGSACTLQVAFAPGAGGLRTGTITFTDNAVATTQTMALTGTGIDFSLTPTSATSVTTASGGTAVYTLALASVAGVPGTVTLACAGNPAHTGCVVTPVSAPLGGTTGLIVTISTGIASLEKPPLPGRVPLSIWWVGLLPLLLLPRRGRLLALVCAACLIAGCGASRLIPSSQIPSSEGGNRTTSGTYPITVSATGAGLTRTVALTLVVQ